MAGEDACSCCWRADGGHVEVHPKENEDEAILPAYADGDGEVDEHHGDAQRRRYWWQGRITTTMVDT